MRPAKQFDDIADVLRALGVTWGMPAAQRTMREEIEHRMPEELTTTLLAEHYGQPGFGELVVAKIAEENQIKIQIEEERKAQDELLRNAFGGGGRIRLFGNKRR